MRQGIVAPCHKRKSPDRLPSFTVRMRLIGIEPVRKPKCNMRDDQHRFLTLLGQLPARLTAEQAAWVLNCQQHDVPILVASRLLKPLGNPPPNGIKFFATVDV